MILARLRYEPKALVRTYVYGIALNATLRLPAAQLDAALAPLRRLGHVHDESQRGEEVTQRHVDIEARLANAPNTEQRLTEEYRQALATERSSLLTRIRNARRR